MLERSTLSTHPVPYKSVAAALTFTVLLGPIGLLYATFWGGFFMIMLGIVIIGSFLFYPILLFWIACCIWGVRATESHNKRILKFFAQNKGVIT